MKNIFLMALLSLSLAACQDRSKPSVEEEQPEESVDLYSVDVIPISQLENEADQMIAQKIQQIISEDPALSSLAKNIKFAPKDGVVTLTGTVPSEKDKEVIVKKVTNVPGVLKVDDHLKVK